MQPADLAKLHAAVEFLVGEPFFADLVARSKRELARTVEPFAWCTIDLAKIDRELPAEIRSCWIFVLRKNAPSGAHYHPNSVQHMVTIEGRGRSEVGRVRGSMLCFDAPGRSIAEKWYVIERGVPHEFFPEGADAIVVSFHTCGESELEEIACETGRSERYEGEP